MADPALHQALSTALSAKVFLPGTSGYNESTTSYYSAFEHELKPGLVLKPASKEDVAAIVKITKPFVARGKVQLAIRGGGATPVAGVANINNGITIDMRSVTGITLHPENSTVSIGAGESWGDVYGKLEAEGLAVAGARTSRSGVGGHLTNGGLSFFSARKGFPCDNVVNFEVVLSSGEIVNANAEENRDLWIALRGGGNNFGIVTRFDMATFGQGQLWGGSVFYDAAKFPGQLEALSDFLTRSNDAYAHILISVGYAANFGGLLAKNTVYYTTNQPDPPALRPFSTGIQPQLDALRSLRSATVKSFADEQAAGGKDGRRQLYMTTTFKLDVELMRAVTDTFHTTVDNMKPVPGLIYSLSFQPLSEALLTESAARGGNSLGLSPADGPLIVVLLYSYWADASDDKTVISLQQVFLRQVERLAATRGKASSFKFMPYAYAGQDPIDGYGSTSKAKLQATSRKYDPDGFFQKGVPGGFKLFP
ncbi:MAG: hypothetical protein Q9187_004711 [Circinaria calcarea]